MKKFSKWIALAVVLILAITLPLVLRFIGTRQELRKKAAPETTLSFAEVTNIVGLNQPFIVDAALDPGSNQITAIELHISYDPTLLQVNSITPMAVLPVILTPAAIDNASGSASITLGANPLQPVSSPNHIATITFQTKNTESSTQVTYGSDTKASAIGETGNVVTSMVPFVVSIATARPTTTIIPTPTPTNPCGGQPNGTNCLIEQCPSCYYSVPRCLAPCVAIEGVCQNQTCVIPSPTPTPTPTPTPQPSEIFNFLLKFGGVPAGNAVGANVTIRFVNGTSTNLITPPVPVSYQGNGVYQASIVLETSKLPPGPYNVIVKGEKHIARKFCKFSGQTQPCAAGETLTIPASFTSPSVTFDFTGLQLDPGDVPPQDNKADSADFDKVKTLMSKPCSALTEGELATGDLNYDGCVNTLDAFLMRKTLEIRYDDN